MNTVTIDVSSVAMAEAHKRRGRPGKSFTQEN